MARSEMIRGNSLTPLQFLPNRDGNKELAFVLTVDKLDDIALIKQVAQRNEDALGELYDRYGRLVLSVAYGIVQNSETAEEVTLDIFRRAWEKADTYDPDKAKVSTWLTRMARNRAIDRTRREKVRPFKKSVQWAEATTVLVTEKNLPEELVQLRFEKHRVRMAVQALPTDQKEALSLAFFQGYSHSEIAQLLDQPLGTVKGRIRGAMKKLRDALESPIQNQIKK